MNPCLRRADKPPHWALSAYFCVAFFLTSCAGPTDQGRVSLNPGAPSPTKVLESDSGVYRGNIQRTGEYAATGPSQLHGLGWKYTRELSSDVLISSLAVTVAGVYFVTSDSSLHQLDVTTGKQQWQDRSYGATPTVANGIVYYGWHGTLYAADTTTHRRVWQFPTNDDILSSPAVSNGRIYFGSKDGNLYAVETLTGQLAWKFKVGDQVISDPAVSDGIVYIAGSVLLHTPGTDVVDSREQIYAVDAATGAQRWTFPTPVSVNKPVVADGMVYCVGYYSNVVYALEAKSGQQVWQYSPPDGLGYDAVPVIANGVLYITGQATLHAVDLTTRQERWELTTPISIAPPSIAQGVLYFGGGDKYLHAVNALTGHEQWRFPTDGAFIQPPVIAAGTVYALTLNSIYAIR